MISDFHPCNDHSSTQLSRTLGQLRSALDIPSLYYMDCRNPIYVRAPNGCNVTVLVHPTWFPLRDHKLAVSVLKVLQNACTIVEFLVPTFIWSDFLFARRT